MSSIMIDSVLLDSVLRWGALWLLAASVGIAVIALLRPLVRRHTGARGVLALWWILPVALLVVAVPKEVVVEVEMSSSPAVMWNEPPEQADTPQPATPAARSNEHSKLDWRVLLLSAWFCGVLALALHFAHAQWRYARTIDWRKGKRGTLPAEGVPAVVGVLTPRIALPADFRTRYSAAERRLILLHEVVHQRRRDGLANFCMTLLRVLLWFNPLVHWAARALGDDQESACDAAVIARHPDAVRIYAEALLRSNARVSPLPLVCHWQAYHPTVKRIAMLKQHRLGKRGTLLSRGLFAFGALFAAAAVYALQPAREVQVVRDANALNTEVSVPDESPLPRIQLAQVVPMKPLARQAPFQTAALSAPAGNVELPGPTAATEGNRAFYVGMDIKQDGVTIQSPSVVTTNGRPLMVSSGGHAGQPDIELRVVPTQQADGSIEFDVKAKLSTIEASAARTTRTSEFKFRTLLRERAHISLDSPSGSVLELTLQATPVPLQAAKTGAATTSIPIGQALVCDGAKTTRLPALMTLLGDDVSVLALSRDETANMVRLQGSTVSNARISQLMRDLSTSAYFEKPNLLEVRVAEGPVNNFVMEFGLKCAAPSATEQAADSAQIRMGPDLHLAVNFTDIPVPSLVGVLGSGIRRKVNGLEALAGERLTVKRANVNADRLMRAALSCHGYVLQETGGEWRAVRDAGLAPASDPSACVAAAAPDVPKKPFLNAVALADPNEQFQVSLKLRQAAEAVSSLEEQVIVGKVMKLPLQDDLALTCSLMRVAQQLYLRCVEGKDGEPTTGRKANVMAKIGIDQPGRARVATRLGEYELDFSAARMKSGAQQAS
jgi:bla regulator protein blaR1